LNYQTKVDPRLNAMQSAELSFKVGEKLKKIGK
jgi:3-deoxy-D-arabino-heptulosonate 7-phosphate (DAHP) synthase class II